MLSILINAYACSPNMGSEPGMAWNWCVNLAQHCELHIITEGEFRDKIEQVVPTLAQGRNMHFYYNPVSEEIRRMCWNQGDWRFYKYYREWQWKTYLMAKDICQQTRIDILHQLNMIGFREPGYLWKIENKPFIWGPVDAKEKFPVAYLQGAPLKAQLFIRLKNFLTSLQLRYAGRVHQAARRASFIVSASSESQWSFQKYFGIASPLINETGCYPHPTGTASISKKKETFDLLWVGKMDFRKQLSLALQTMTKLNRPNIRLHIVGGGNAQPYQQEAEALNVNERCIWHGAVSHEEVQRLMKEADIFFFTSVAEGTPHVVLEAIGNSLPIVSFDVCGQGDSVNEKVGIKIPLSNPQKSVDDFAKEITYLYENPAMLQQLAAGCKERQKKLSWESKALQMVELYKQMTHEQ